MVNASDILAEINNMIPACERPQHTEGYEGFYHLTSLCGSVESGKSSYIVRDHSMEKFEKRKKFLQDLASFMESKYGKDVVVLELKDQYYNMRQMVEPHPDVIEYAKKAMTMAGVTPLVRPIRGGTDGARLSFMGLPCPNLFTGGMNFHGKFEYCCVETMQNSLQVIINLAQLWTK